MIYTKKCLNIVFYIKISQFNYDSFILKLDKKAVREF